MLGGIGLCPSSEWDPRSQLGHALLWCCLLCYVLHAHPLNGKRRALWPGAFPAGRSVLLSASQGVASCLGTPKPDTCRLFPGRGQLTWLLCWSHTPLARTPFALVSGSLPFHLSSLTFYLCSCFPHLESTGFSQQGDLTSLQKAGVMLAALSRASCTALVFSAWFSLLLVPLLR